ncbi:hypothetical protein WJX77_008988 [Trebouxia sp. C0004]
MEPAAPEPSVGVPVTCDTAKENRRNAISAVAAKRRAGRCTRRLHRSNSHQNKHLPRHRTTRTFHFPNQPFKS